MDTLRELAVQKFGEGFTEAEERLLKNAPQGKPADMRTPFPEMSLSPQIIQFIKDQTPKTFNKFLNSPEQKKHPTFTTQGIVVISKWLQDNNPANADNWPGDRRVRAEIIKWVLLDRDARQCLQPVGLALVGIKIIEPLGLDFCTIEHPIRFHGCALSSISLIESATKRINFNGSLINGFVADSLLIRGSAFFRSIESRGEFRLPSANIEGQLECIGAHFINDNGIAFAADSMTVKGNSLFEGVESRGEFLLPDANIEGKLSFNDAHFINEKKVSFNANTINVKGNALFNDVESRGVFKLYSANIEGQLSCNDAHFINGNGISFGADGMSVMKGAFFKAVKSRGQFRLLSANIEGQLVCNSAHFINGNQISFVADNMNVKGDSLFEGVESSGEFKLYSANIEGQLSLVAARFINFTGTAISLQSTRVHQEFFAKKIPNIIGKMELNHAKVGSLIDDERSWPREGMLMLDGFEYGGFAGDNTPRAAKDRLKWLELQPNRPFHPQPYEQLAKYYKQVGHRSDWRKVLIAKKVRRRKYGNMSSLGKIWSYFLGAVVAHGYKPWRAIGFLIILWLVGFGLFYLGNQSQLMQPTNPKVYITNGKEVAQDHKDWPTRYPVFNSATYSLDTLIPFLDLDQEDHWAPDATRNAGFHLFDISSGAWLRFYLWVHIIAGWFFATLGAVSLTGIVRKDE